MTAYIRITEEAECPHDHKGLDIFCGVTYDVIHEEGKPYTEKEVRAANECLKTMMAIAESSGMKPIEGVKDIKDTTIPPRGPKTVQ